MKPMYLLTAVATVVLVALAGFAVAEIPANQTPETQALASSTAIDCLGTVTNSNALSWQISSETLHDPPLHPGGYPFKWFDKAGNPVVGWTVDPPVPDMIGDPVPPGEIRYSAGYTADTIAVQGETTLSKTVGVDTANRVADGSNIATNTLLTFVAADTGRATSNEEILVDGVGTHTTSLDKILCPFGTSSGPFFPPFCTIVQSGSSVDVTIASVATSASERFVAATADVPVVQAYSINGKGITTSPGQSEATGLMNAFGRVHIQEGRMNQFTVFNPNAVEQPGVFQFDKSEDITYTQSASASGLIGSFAQSFAYQDGVRRI